MSRNIHPIAAVLRRMRHYDCNKTREKTADSFYTPVRRPRKARKRKDVLEAIR